MSVVESSRRILINASNLHVGGGVQVAASFIIELSRMRIGMREIRYVVYASTEVHRNLKAAGFASGDLDDYQVFDIHGLAALLGENAKRFEAFDLVFTIFGPLYIPRRIPNHIVGFAQPWIIYPDNEVAGRLSLKDRLLLRLKFAAQWRFFRTAERLVVELAHVRERLVILKDLPIERVSVVPNCVAAIYFEESRWAPVAGLGKSTDDVIRLGYVARDYPHKNLSFLVDVAHELVRISARRYKFFVTLTPEEWQQRSSSFTECVFNVGPLTVAQCPSFYRAMDAVFFPSLLECFSATPLEAMAMRRPLFASDRDFVRDCCGDNAVYIDPVDARQAAACIDDWFCHTLPEARRAHVERAYQHLRTLPRSVDRAKAYIRLIEAQLSNSLEPK